MTCEDQDQAAEIAARWAAEDATRAWVELRDAILAEGGISPNADYSHESMPGPLYRLAGHPADDIAWRLGFERADDLLDTAWRLYDRYQEAQAEAARRRHATDVAPVAATAPRRQRGKLTLDDAQVIRDLVAVGENRRALAEAWGVHVSTIGDIARGAYLRPTSATA